tara:strand:- start:240 stop:476 length:237 start_codon:yes stop_codon:yes gene_type:complete
MNNDRERYYQAKMALAIKLSEDTIYGGAVKCIAEMYNKDKDNRHMRSIDALMRVAVGNHWSCGKCGINQYGFWSKEEE